jgi:hypothetical protein
MLPIRAYDRALDWTWDYLQEARLDQVQADIMDAIRDARTLWRVALLTRLLKRGDDSGVILGLGTGGESPGFATAAASTGVDFAPPSMGGVTFDTDHEHYVGIAGGTWTLAVFQDAKSELREHGHEPPYTMLIGPADEAEVRAITGFVAAPSVGNLIQFGALQDVARLDTSLDGNGNYAIGVLEDFVIRVVLGMPEHYGFAFKSYGPNSQRNPLRVRLPNGQRRPVVVAMPDPRAGSSGAYPLNYLMLYTKFGVGVADRTNGTARYVNNATWADGTPT